MRAWHLIPFIDGIDCIRLQEQMDSARSLIPLLEHQLTSRLLTPKFLSDWGAFCAAAGAARLLYFSESTPGHRRKGSVGGSESLDQHRIWFARQFLLMHRGHGSKERTLQGMLELLRSLVKGEVVDADAYPKNWFARFFKPPEGLGVEQEYEELSGAFQKDLTIAEMKRLLKNDTTFPTLA